MTWRDTLEIGLKENASYRKDNLPPSEVEGLELPQGPGRSAEIPGARGHRPHDEQQRSAMAGWDNEGGAVSSDRDRVADMRREESFERAGRRAAVDVAHESTTRGEHRYPDANQTEAEKIARDDRDALKRKLGGMRWGPRS